MTKAIGFLLGAVACSLLAMDCNADPSIGKLFTKCNNELFKSLNKFGLDVKYVEDKLEAVEDKKNVFIGQISVEDILSFRDKALKLRDFADCELLKTRRASYSCAEGGNFFEPAHIIINWGIESFMNHYKRVLAESCAAKVVPLLKELEAKLDNQDRINLDALSSANAKLWAPASCQNAIDFLRKRVPCSTLNLVKSQDVLIHYWFKIVFDCSRFTNYSYICW